MRLTGSPIWNLYAPKVFESRMGEDIMFPHSQLVYDRKDLLCWSFYRKNEDVDSIIGQSMTLELKKYLRFTKNRYNCVNVALYDGAWMHANVLIFDTKTKTADLYEPHGQCLNEECRRFFEDVEPFIEGFVGKLGYTLTIKSADSCPRLGIQVVYELNCLEALKGESGFCATWIYVFMEFRIKFPDMGYKALEEYIIQHHGCEIIDTVREYGTQVERMVKEDYPNIYKELQFLPKQSNRYLVILKQIENDFRIALFNRK